MNPLYERISKSLGILERKKIDISESDYEERLDKREQAPDKTNTGSRLPTLIYVDEVLLKFLTKIFLDKNVKPMFKSMDKRFSLSLLERNAAGKVILPVMLLQRNEVSRQYDKIPGKIDPLMPQAEFVYYKPRYSPPHRTDYIEMDKYVQEIKERYNNKTFNKIKSNSQLDIYPENIERIRRVEQDSGENSITGYYVIFPEYVSISYSVDCITSTKEEMNTLLERFLHYDRYYIVDRSYFIQYTGPDSYTIENELVLEEERLVKLSFNFLINCFIFVDRPRPLPKVSSLTVEIKVQ